MIKNLNYIKTAIEVLEGGTSDMNQLKILKVIKEICQQNIDRIEGELVDRVESRLYNNDTKTTEGAK